MITCGEFVLTSKLNFYSYRTYNKSRLLKDSSNWPLWKWNAPRRNSWHLNTTTLWHEAVHVLTCPYSQRLLSAAPYTKLSHCQHFNLVLPVRLKPHDHSGVQLLPVSPRHPGDVGNYPLLSWRHVFTEYNDRPLSQTRRVWQHPVDANLTGSDGANSDVLGRRGSCRWGSETFHMVSIL